MAEEHAKRKAYPSDLTDAQWAILEPLLPAPRNPDGGRPREVERREVLNTLLYLNRSGCQGEMLAQDLLPKSSVYDYFARWREDGTWTQIRTALRKRVRQEVGREPTPSAAGIDSQSVKTPEVGGKERGDEGGKKSKGRQRHLRVDRLGLVLAVLITRAHMEDGVAAVAVLKQVQVHDFPACRPSSPTANITIMRSPTG